MILVYPFFIAWFPIIALFAHNIEQTSYQTLLLPIVIAGVFTLFLLLLLWFFVGRKKAALVVSFFLFIFFSFGYIRTGIEGTFLDSFGFARDRYLLAILSTVVFIFSTWVLRAKRDFASASRIVAVVSLVLVTMPLLQVISFEFTRSRSGYEQQSHLKDGGSGGPNIYYIILDGYGRADTLKALYGFDNSDFLIQLEKRGFFVASESRSNYMQTFLSLASSLNMKHVAYLSQELGEDAQNREVPYALIENSEVRQFLKSRGYTFVHISSGSSEMTNTNRFADINLKGGKIDEFSLVLVETTALYPFVRNIIEADSRDRVLYAFDALSRVPDFASPRFTFAHIIVPHPPFVFGPNGEQIADPKLQLAGTNYWKLKNHYIDQVKFTNTKVLALVDDILRKEKTPPVIIFQGDHGPASTGDGPKGISQASPFLIQERMKILNAYYLPDGRSVLRSDITPVNSFRAIFNYLFNAQLAYEKEQSYFSSEEFPYRFIDVTDWAKKTY